MSHLESQLTPEQRAIRAAQLQLCQMLGIGGALWQRQRYQDADTDGSADPFVPPASVLVTAYVRMSEPSRAGITATGQPVQIAPQYRLFDFSAQDIRPGDVLISQAESALVFTVQGMSDGAGFGRYAVERRP